MVNVTIMSTSSATGSLPETSPCNHHSKQVTVCYQDSAPVAGTCPCSCLPSLVGQTPLPYKDPQCMVLWCVGGEAVWIPFFTYTYLSGTNGIRDKIFRNLEVWMGWAAALSYLILNAELTKGLPLTSVHLKDNSLLHPCSKQVFFLPGPSQVSKEKSRSRKRSGHLNFSFASQNKMNEQLNSCKMIKRV